jgi:glycosyltransferase involved in cell wall biosynthesis
MALVHRAGKKIVFSPITLDLQNYPIFQQFLEHIVSRYDLDTIEKVIDALPSLMSTKLKDTANLDNHIEGITGHFEALRRCCQLADSIICLSNRERDFLAKIGVDTTKSTIVQNGIDFDFATNVNHDLFRNKFSLNNYVLCVGRIEYRKNQALLAYALRNKDVSLVLLGDASDTLYLDRVKSLGGNKLIHIPRIEDRTLLASAYLGASAFVLPSWCEGAPISALEAAICGTPLVLSNMSSEREYFGNHAHYVSPANTDEIENAIDTAMQEHADESKRQARVELVQNEFSAKLHVQKTLEVYKRALELETKQNTQKILLDVSAMLHYYRIDKHLTGIPLAERSIVSEIMKVKPDTRCLVYNGPIGRFIEIPFSVFSNFDSESFNKRYWFSSDQAFKGTDEKYDSHYFCKLVTPSAIVAPPKPGATQEKKRSILRRMASHGYQQLNKFAIFMPILRRTKNSLYMSVHYYRTVRNRLVARHPLGKSNVGIDTSNLSQYFDIKQLPKESLKINPGSRIISLGQGWLSNEPLLNELVRIAAGNKLEAYVYDISYVTGSHFSGWNDNQDRQRRLDKLLKNCSTVFTESKITASELAKYGNTRSFNYQVVRTKLRGKDLSQVKRFGSSGNKTKFILYVASFNRRKNHDFIVNVWKDLQQSQNAISNKGIKLYLVGEIQGETKYGDLSLRKHLKQFNIEVLGGVSEKKLAKYYQNCLFTIFPSLQEGWGIPVEESLMYRKVCLTSNAVPAAHEINNPALIKLAPHDFFGWREALITWASNVKMREEFGKRAEKYTPIEWKTITECILNCRNIED